MVPLGALRTLALALTPSIPALTDDSRCHPRACLHSDLFRVSRGSSHPRTPEHAVRWMVGTSPTMTTWVPSERGTTLEGFYSVSSRACRPVAWTRACAGMTAPLTRRLGLAAFGLLGRGFGLGGLALEALLLWLGFGGVVARHALGEAGRVEEARHAVGWLCPDGEPVLGPL